MNTPSVGEDEARRVAEAAWAIRRHVIHMCMGRGEGYAGQGLELADILAALFHAVMRRKPDGSLLDRFVLSTGHSAIALYATLGTLGVYSDEELRSYGADGTKIEESPLEGAPGFEITGGSLGLGASQAVGIAMGELLRNSGAHVFCELSDGELQEGSVWEAFMFAGVRRLPNLTFLVDRNGEQADGAISRILDLEPVEAKLQSFGLNAWSVDGHDVNALLVGLRKARRLLAPTALVCRTRPGKGIPTLERYSNVHYIRAGREVWEEALRELEHQRPV